MIEIELKYKLKKYPNILFPLVEEKNEEDIYYDTKDYTLLKNGNFLRIRNGEKIDFKLSTNDLTHLYCKETRFSVHPFPKSDIKSILEQLSVKIPCQKMEDLVGNLSVLAPIIKFRKTYKIDKHISLVLDKITDLGYFLEIEYDVEEDSITKEEANQYQEQLENILKENYLISKEDTKVNIGYVELYLKTHNKEAYNLGIYKD